MAVGRVLLQMWLRYKIKKVGSKYLSVKLSTFTVAKIVSFGHSGHIDGLALGHVEGAISGQLLVKFILP